MNKEILEHYLEFGLFTNPGCYKKFLQENLPNDVGQVGLLVMKQVIERVILRNGNTGPNSDLRWGDMDKVSWWRLRCEDDVLPNAVSMIAELLRLDDRGFTLNRATEDKIVVTCRHRAILMASILKTKGIPCRVRSGFSSYFPGFEGSWDHWINQYWDAKQKRWVTVDVEGCFENLRFEAFDIPKGKFDFPADTWLGIRKGLLDEDRFINAGGFKGLEPVLWAIFYDFHSLMNNEIRYLHTPNYIWNKFGKLTENDFLEIDELAELLSNPDANFRKLKDVWIEKKKFRILSGSLISDRDHTKWK